MQKLIDIIGQETAIKVLKAGLPPEEPGHAYIFAGPKGTGKRSTAYAWAAALLCEAGEKDACGVCGACRKSLSGSSPDLIVIKPEVREKRVTEVIDIGRIRELISHLSFKPYEARLKIVIMEGADTMNLSAANAFLKTLEEPPGDTVIILIVENTGKLPMTIISRCQTVRFRPLPYEKIFEFVKMKLQISDNEASAIASLSRGRPGAAIAGALDREKDAREQVLSLFDNTESFGPEEYKLAQNTDKSKDRLQADRILASAQELVRDMVTVKISGKCDNLINMDIRSAIEKVAGRYSLRRLFRIYDVLQEMILARKLNVNPLLIISLLSLELKE
ncbi:DNA polymerase III delta prime subunit [hydrothermal vent metagenome]|uniref:DNA polymerase III delta prime subunit n=1 Tax=hydrothermal vent metagenome TaxID=652676 RepID=A0A3B1C8C1_9ZZZZ